MKYFCLCIALLSALVLSSPGKNSYSSISAQEYSKLEREREIEAQNVKNENYNLRKEVDSLRHRLDTDWAEHRAEIAGLQHPRSENTSDILVPILVPMTLFSALGFMVWIFLTSRNKERLAAIEKGLDAEMTRAIFGSHWQERKPSGSSSLRWGLLLMGIGFGGYLGFFMNYSQPEMGLFLGSLAGGGMGLLIFFLLSHFLIKKSND